MPLIGYQEPPLNPTCKWYTCKNQKPETHTFYRLEKEKKNGVEDTPSEKGLLTFEAESVNTNTNQQEK